MLTRTRVRDEVASPIGHASRGAASTEKQPQATPVRIEVRNVRLHVDDGIVLEIERLRGEMVSRSPGQPSKPSS